LEQLPSTDRADAIELTVISRSIRHKREVGREQFGAREGHDYTSGASVYGGQAEMLWIQRWLAAKVIAFGLWILGFDYRHMAGLECVLGHVKAYRERMAGVGPRSSEEEQR
jgi:hypothetical protein